MDLKAADTAKPNITMSLASSGFGILAQSAAAQQMMGIEINDNTIDFYGIAFTFDGEGDGCNLPDAGTNETVGNGLQNYYPNGLSIPKPPDLPTEPP